MINYTPSREAFIRPLALAFVQLGLRRAPGSRGREVFLQFSDLAKSLLMRLYIIYTLRCVPAGETISKRGYLDRHNHVITRGSALRGRGEAEGAEV